MLNPRNGISQVKVMYLVGQKTWLDLQDNCLRTSPKRTQAFYNMCIAINWATLALWEEVKLAKTAWLGNPQVLPRVGAVRAVKMLLHSIGVFVKVKNDTRHTMCIQHKSNSVLFRIRILTHLCWATVRQHSERKVSQAWRVNTHTD